LARIPAEQIVALQAEIGRTEHLRRMVDEVERLHRVVFHGDVQADWSKVRASAEQIVVAEIVGRHHGRSDGMYYALRNLEMQGRTWEAAILSLAATIHSYYTTPLGIVMRHDLFGEQAVFFTPDALEWIEGRRRQQEAGSTGSP
jgi:hypothetical protein